MGVIGPTGKPKIAAAATHGRRLQSGSRRVFAMPHHSFSGLRLRGLRGEQTREGGRHVLVCKTLPRRRRPLASAATSRPRLRSYLLIGHWSERRWATRTGEAVFVGPTSKITDFMGQVEERACPLFCATRARISHEGGRHDWDTGIGRKRGTAPRARACPSFQISIPRPMSARQLKL